MRNVSSEFRKTMEVRRDFYAKAEITFRDGTVKSLGKDDFSMNGNQVVESAESSSFPIGILVTKQATITINNYDDRWSDFDFQWAEISLKLCLDLDDGRTESINIGNFTVITPESYGTTIGITAMDDSYRLDRDYGTSLNFPASMNAAFRDSCLTCGVSFRMHSFGDFVIQQKPEGITHRQFIGMCAMIAGGNAKFDEHNRLKIIPYDLSVLKFWADGGAFDLLGSAPYKTGDRFNGGSFSPWGSGDSLDGGGFDDRGDTHILYAFNSGLQIETDDVVITGIRLKADESEWLYGKEGYVLSLENKLAIGQEYAASKIIGDKIIGIRFRPFTGDHVAYPLAEFGDPALLVDRKNNIYQTLLTDVDFSYCGFTILKCSADSPIRNSSRYTSESAKAIVESKKLIEKEKTERERAIEELSKELAQSSGLYMTQETQQDGSTIYYMHDKPTLKESKIVWKMTAEAFGVSTDGGKTYPYGLDATGMAILNRIYAIGINCDYLTTGAFEIRKNGKVMVLMDKDTGQVILRPDVFELSNGDTIGSIAEAKAQENVNDFVSSVYAHEIASLQAQIDGQIETWYYDYQPTLNNKPASSWKTEADRAKHEGDLFYWKSKGYSYRFFKDSGTWKWQIITDSDITKALSDASKAQDTADHKRRVFVVTPSPPYDVGDLWTQGVNGDIMRCKVARASGNYVAGDWIKASKYTDDSALNTFLNGEFKNSIDDLQAQADKKAETWYQPSDPSVAWTTAESKREHIGDMWFNSTASVQKTYRWTGAKWEEMKTNPPPEVFDKIDGKAQVFIAPPKPPYDVGDLWFNSTTSDIMTCVIARESGDRVESDWQKRNKYIDQAAADNAAKDAVEGQTQLDILNKLTDNGKDNGIYLHEKKLYISFSAARGGVLQLGGANNVSGLMEILNASGVLVGKWDKDGAVFTDASKKSSFFISGSKIESRSPDGEVYGMISYAPENSSFGNGINIKSMYGGVIFTVNTSPKGITPLVTNVLSIYSEELKSQKNFKRNIVFHAIPLFNAGLECAGVLTSSGVARLDGGAQLKNISTASSGGTLVVNTNGVVQKRSSSSIRYKNVKRKMEREDIETLYSISPVLAKYKDGYLTEGDERDGSYYPMLIAEDVERFLPEAATHNNDGVVENWDERVMIPAMFQMLKSQKETMEILEKRISLLEESVKGGL